MDGQNYWLWIVYELNTYTSVFVISYIYIYIYISQEKERFCLLSVFQAEQNEIWKKETNLH